MQLAIELEKELDQVLTPHKVVLGVAACKHGEVNMLTMDIGVIGTNRGWEVYVGGSVNPIFQEGELLTVTNTSDEVKQLICGFIQYYRETANFLEQVCDWTRRVGIIHIREVLFEDSLREQLLERLEIELLPYTEKSL